MSETSLMSKTSPVKNAVHVIIVASGLTLILYLVPFFHPIAYPFSLLSTFVHEMGHGIAALVVGGHFDSFKMWANGSGVASISGDFGSLSRAFVAAMGLLGPSLVALLFFLAVTSGLRSRIVLASFAIVLVLAIMLVVRNIFALCFVSVVAAISFYFSLGSGKKYCQLVLAFFAAQLALSVFARSDYLFTDVAVTSMGMMPSDVAQIAQALFLPYWFWGALCGLVSIGILIFGIMYVFKQQVSK